MEKGVCYAVDKPHWHAAKITFEKPNRAIRALSDLQSRPAKLNRLLGKKPASFFSFSLNPLEERLQALRQVAFVSALDRYLVLPMLLANLSRGPHQSKNETARPFIVLCWAE